jgi:hypothetical protein
MRLVVPRVTLLMQPSELNLVMQLLELAVQSAVL